MKMNIFKKYLFYVVLLNIAAFSCEQEPVIFDGLSEGHFVTTSGDYFVTQSGDPGFEVVIGRTSPGGAVTYNIIVDQENSTAVEGEDFTLSTKSL